MNLPASSLADRAGHEPSRGRREGRAGGLSGFHPPLSLPSPPPTFPPHPSPNSSPHPTGPNLYAHLNSLTHTHTGPRAAKLCSIPVPLATSRTVDQTPPQPEGGSQRLQGVGEYSLVIPMGWLCKLILRWVFAVSDKEAKSKAKPRRDEDSSFRFPVVHSSPWTACKFGRWRWSRRLGRPGTQRRARDC